MNIDASGRVLPILAGNMMTPACCAMCGKSASSVRETFADPAIYIEFHGNLYFCRDCALGVAAIFGAQSDDEVLALRNHRDELLAKVAVQHAMIQDLNGVADAFAAKWITSRTATDSSSDELFASQGSDESESTSQQYSKKPVRDRTSTSTEPNQPGKNDGTTESSRSKSDDDPALTRFLNNL